jgi:hypothetical protein
MDAAVRRFIDPTNNFYVCMVARVERKFKEAGLGLPSGLMDSDWQLAQLRIAKTCARTMRTLAVWNSACFEIENLYQGVDLSETITKEQFNRMSVEGAAYRDSASVALQPELPSSPGAAMVIVDCSNVGHYQKGVGSRGSVTFNWEHVECALNFYVSRRVPVAGTISPRTLMRNPIPSNFRYKYLLTQPPSGGKNDDDDKFAILCAFNESKRSGQIAQM